MVHRLRVRTSHAPEVRLLPSPVRVLQGALMLLASVALILGPGTSMASAHDRLIGSDPPDGAELDTAPGSLVLTFSSDQLDVGAAVAVTGRDGTPWTDGAPVVDGTTVTQPLLPQLPSGAYAVEWRSASSDGHPISGTMSFTLAVPEPVVELEPTSEPEPSAAPEATAEPRVDEESGAADQPTQAAGEAAADEDSDGSSGPGPWIAAALAAAAVAAVGTLIALRRRAARTDGTGMNERG